MRKTQKLSLHQVLKMVAIRIENCSSLRLGGAGGKCFELFSCNWLLLIKIIQKDWKNSGTLKNEIDHPKRLETFSTIKPKYLYQMINIVREEQKIACLKRSDQFTETRNRLP
jgi:hypothetical protein